MKQMENKREKRGMTGEKVEDGRERERGEGQKRGEERRK